ncbi:hypothetical protein Tco_1547993 [Tanacetum coccineum]
MNSRSRSLANNSLKKLSASREATRALLKYGGVPPPYNSILIINLKLLKHINEIEGITDIVPTLWSPTKVGYDKDALKRIKHWGEGQIVVKRAHRQFYKFKECDFVDLHLNEIEDMLLLAVQHKLFHLTDINIVDFIVALQMEFKELYTPSHNPPGVIYEDLTKVKRVMRADELYMFSDGKLKKVWDELHHRVRNFCLEYNKEMRRRKWTVIDRKRSKLMVELIDKQMRERRIIRNLEILVGAQELKKDYKLMTRNT